MFLPVNQSGTDLLAMLAKATEEGKAASAVMMNTDYDEYLIADLNPDLVNLYKAMAYHTDAFLVELETLFSAGALGEQESRAIFYYAVRDAFNLSGKGLGAESVEAAARFMYLNRHGFNGLCRYNRHGQFNVPFGKYKKNYFPLKRSGHLLKRQSARRSSPRITPKRLRWFVPGMWSIAIRHT
ncbi:D12 class N6 adenine-specific DNA methyltransferase family protein [Candidatus Erwinia dacicola]|uniref:site-specific DNA-methyltransferase (adenine-specific) n=1 Tax=Candidatus Erwinia dacicola TaxID=252393 RepID=A0A328TU35_9GAMM|nr:D12 class N6 adenine-specific DNA methyltransferase family protein [Candidatus Erwinia dacicola]